MHFVSYWKFGGGGDIGANLVSQAAAKINYLAGNGTTTSVILAQGLIVEGSCSCANPVLITRGIEKTTKALVTELKLMSQEVEDGELANIAAVSAVSYPLKVTANNAGVDGNVVSEKVLNLDDHKYGYNAATGNYEDLMVAGIIDPAKCRSRVLTSACSAIYLFCLGGIHGTCSQAPGQGVRPVTTEPFES
ncbi:chaperonin 60 subunit beta 3, chloroplastic-like isoform X2 [Apium graveolens]|uniref:chaperonin 60 subunit beta 3, chloroplastic-like isoform X2 n=1 Tax=Apium graveolens TaxID=4045 RepID=UPI003D7B6679